MRDALLRRDDRRGAGGGRHRAGRAVARGRPVRRRAVVGVDARASSSARSACARATVYGLSEIIGPGVAAECEEARRLAPQRGPLPASRSSTRTAASRSPRRARRAGDHDADQGGAAAAPLPHGRHRRRSTTSRARAGARCARMGPIRGRRDDMLILRGVNVYPSEIEHVLLGVDGRRAALRADRRAPRRVGRGPGPLRDRRRDAGGRAGARACAPRCASAPGSGSTSSSSPPARCRAARARPSGSSTAARADPDAAACARLSALMTAAPRPCRTRRRAR